MKINSIAGAERHLLTLMGAQVERELDVHLLMMVDPKQPMLDMQRQSEEVGATVHRLVIRNHLDVLIIWRLRGVLRRIKPDVVHTHLIHGDTYGVPAAKLARKPVVSSRHDDSDFRRNFLIRLLNRLIWRRIDRGIAISEALSRFSIAVEGAPEKRIRVVHYGIPHYRMQSSAIQDAQNALRDELNLSKSAVLLGTVSRLIALKGVHYALEAFAQIASSYPDAHFVIVGDGPERNKLERQVVKDKLTQRVHFMGWQSDVERIFGGLDILLVPSTREGFGLVLLEAMSKRVAVIASNVSAIPEVVEHGETGLLVPPRNPDSLAQAMRMLVDDRALRAYMGLMAEDRLEQHFTVARMADETIAVYNEVVSKRK
ncbi:MAG: glycosyltransferase family 4 protein [Anaerolineae bacterium]|nr:glycosyltransferase family 4 protein [Anaerolineae bacterium]